MFHRKEIIKDGFWSVLLHILYYFALKMFIDCMIASAARWLIARGLGVIYFVVKIFEKIEQDTRVWVYILI